MDQPASALSLSQSFIETKELVGHLRKRKWRYLLIILLTGFLSFYYLKFRLLEYSATTSFFVNDLSVVSNSPLESLPYGDNLNRIFQMVNSTRIQMHLINKFNLYNHYGIDTTKEFYLQNAIGTIRSKIEVKKNPYNAITVTVKDKDRFLSADMANELVAFIDTLNQEFFIKKIQNAIKLSQAYLVHLEQDNKIKSVEIESLINDINTIIKSERINSVNQYYLLSHQQKLSELVNVFKTTTSDILNTNKMYNLSLQTINFNNYPTVSIIQTAMPAANSGALKTLLFSSLLMLVVFLFLVLQAYYLLHYKEYLKLLFMQN